MKLHQGFITHETDGEQIMVSAGKTAFNGMIRSNATAAFIVDCLKEETTEGAIVEKMLERYDAPREVIAADVARIIDTLRKNGVLDE